IYRIVLPAIIIGVATSAVTVAIYLDVIPITHWLLRTRFTSDVEELLYTMLKTNGCINHPRVNFTVHVKGIHGRKLLEAQFMRKDPKNGRFDVIALAKQAELLVDIKNKQLLVNMHHCHITDDKGEMVAFVEDKVWPVEMPSEFFDKP